MWYLIFMGAYLLLLSIIDVLKQRINLFALLFGIIPVALCWIGSSVGLLPGLLGMLPGALLYIVACLSKERFGKADAFVFIGLGVASGIDAILAIAGLSFFISAIYSIAMLILGRVKKGDKIAFIPFIFLAYVMFQIGGTW